MIPLVFTHPEEKHFTFDKIPDLTGKVGIVTGGNSGIGYTTCRELVRKKSHVFLLGRNIEKAQVAVETIKFETDNHDVEFIHLNLKSLKSVKECAENFLASNLPLQILTFSLTEDGIQEEFAVSHVGHYSQPARIVNVAHSLVTGIEFESLNGPNAQDLKQRYRQSKLANILFTDKFNRRYLEGEQVYANSLHPGLVDTPMLRRNDLSFSETLMPSSISPEYGAITTLYCATSSEIEETNYRGRYFVPFGIEGEKSSYAEDDDLAKRLWEFTENLINEKLSQKK
ncbi:NADP-binding protein [Gigaspora margarita]|uniref:NADP-binding protein n=1 Tax=Gigaspora margarita TaxID=4874 RepID=A0A8H4AJ35_GIGMA|nr:NADP-binding protein [Gigaspora margarita]